MTTYIEMPDGSQMEIMAYVAQLEDNVSQLKEMVLVAHALVALAAPLVGRNTMDWHEKADRFLMSCVNLRLP